MLGDWYSIYLFSNNSNPHMVTLVILAVYCDNPFSFILAARFRYVSKVDSFLLLRILVLVLNIKF